MIEKNQTRRNILQTTTAIATATILISTLTDNVSADYNRDLTIPNNEKIKQNIDNHPNLEYVESNPDKGFHYPYLLYTPSSLNTSEESPRPILIRGNNTPPDDDFTTHLYRAKRQALSKGQVFADPIGIPMLHPVFPRYREDPEPWWVYAQTLGPDTFTIEDSPFERVDLQLLEMVDDAKTRLEADGHAIASEVHIDGFSASGTFAHRFTLLHPERVNAVSHGGNHVHTLPKTELDEDVPVVGDPKWDELLYPVGTEKEELPYPVGVANLEELTGSAFNKEAWLNTPEYTYVGSEDDPVPADGKNYKDFSALYTIEARQEARQNPDWPYAMPDLINDIYGVKSIDERWQVSRTVYNNVNANATFTIYDGYGHTPEPAIEDLIEFHKNKIQSTYGSNTTTNQTNTTTNQTNTTTNQTNTTESKSPGFGVGATLSGIAGVGYILKRRVGSD